MKINVRVEINKKKLLAAAALIQAEVIKSVNDIGDDLARASSGAAPHDTGTLDSSYEVKTRAFGAGASVTVSFSATNEGFDYALFMHEGSYNLGEKSLAKPGGIGMSGRLYPVGPKFLERPAQGEAEAYAKHVLDGIDRALGE